MIRQFALGALLLALSGCDQFSSPKPEEAPLPGEEARDAGMAAAEAEAGAAAVEAASVRSECAGFKDGSKRVNSLAGIAIGDSVDTVLTQLRCGELVFETEIRGRDDFDGSMEVVGKNFEDGVTVQLAGKLGQEKVIQVERGAQYDHQAGPSVEDFVANILSKFPSAKELAPYNGRGGRREMGFTVLPGGQVSTDERLVNMCGYEHNRNSKSTGANANMTGVICGKSFVIHFYNEQRKNPGLIYRYGATLSDDAFARQLIAIGRSDGEMRRQQKLKSEVEQAKPVAAF